MTTTTTTTASSSTNITSTNTDITNTDITNTNITNTSTARMIRTHANDNDDDDDDHHHRELLWEQGWSVPHPNNKDTQLLVLVDDDDDDDNNNDDDAPKMDPTTVKRTTPLRRFLTTSSLLLLIVVVVVVVVVLVVMMMMMGPLLVTMRGFSSPSSRSSNPSLFRSSFARNETRFQSGTAAQLRRNEAPVTTNTTTTTTTTTTTIQITPWKNDTKHNNNDTLYAAMAQRALTSVCGKDSATAVGYCKIQGTIGIVAATQLYQTFCPPWNIYVGTQSFLTQEMCVTHAGGFGGVQTTVLTCNGKTSTIDGGFGNLPMSTPSIAGGAVTFPYAGSGYKAHQVVGGSSCTQAYTLGMYCPIAEVPCYVFAAWETSTCGGVPVQVCG